MLVIAALRKNFFFIKMGGYIRVLRPLGYALEYKVTSLSGTFFLNVQCVFFSRLKSFYYDCLSIKYCIFGVASVVAFFYVANGRVYGRTISHKKWKVTSRVVRRPLCRSLCA